MHFGYISNLPLEPPMVLCTRYWNQADWGFEVVPSSWGIPYTITKLRITTEPSNGAPWIKCPSAYALTGTHMVNLSFYHTSLFWLSCENNPELWSFT